MTAWEETPPRITVRKIGGFWFVECPHAWIGVYFPTHAEAISYAHKLAYERNQ